MLSKRVIAVTADKAFGKKLAAGLMGAGANAEVVASLDELSKGEIKAELVVVHLTEGQDKLLDAVSQRLTGEAKIIVVIPSSSVETTVNSMRASGRVAAVLTADEYSPVMLAALATRLLFGDVFGLEKIVPWGVKIYSTLVGDYQEKSVAIAAVSDFAGQLGIRRKYRESIEQCIDEMLMNALYDAPVDSAGKQMFADLPTKTRISLRMEQKAVVQYACEGNLFFLSVRDSFGALKGETVLKYLDKCLHSDQQIDRKAGGAGLGLYIVANASSTVLFNIYPGVATEVIVTFDLNAPKVQLKKFGIFTEKIDSSGRLVAGPSKLLPMPGPQGGGTTVNGPLIAQASRGVTATLGIAIALILLLIGIVAYPRLTSREGTVEVTTTPPGALIEVDGVTKGSSSAEPLKLSLQAGRNYKLVARLSGYHDASELVTPEKGKTAKVSMRLESREPTLVLRTSPAGATVFAGETELGVTPLTVTSLPAGSDQKLTIKKVGYSPFVETVSVPGPGERKEMVFPLQMAGDFGSLRIESDPPGAQVLQNGELMAALQTPVEEHLVQAGRTYVFTIKKPGFQPAVVSVPVKAGARGQAVSVKLVPGGALTVETGLKEARITVDGVAGCAGKPEPLVDCPLANGKYRVRVASNRPFIGESFDVTISSDDVKRALSLGYVEVKGEDLSLQIPGAPPNTRKAAFPDGTRNVKVVNGKTGATTEKSVRVVAGRTVTVDMQ